MSSSEIQSRILLVSRDEVSSVRQGFREYLTGTSMEPNTSQQFATALTTLNGPAIISLLQRLSADDVKLAVHALFSGVLGGPQLDPTNVLCAGDAAD